MAQILVQLDGRRSGKAGGDGLHAVAAEVGVAATRGQDDRALHLVQVLEGVVSPRLLVHPRLVFASARQLDRAVRKVAKTPLDIGLQGGWVEAGEGWFPRVVGQGGVARGEELAPS